MREGSRVGVQSRMGPVPGCRGRELSLGVEDGTRSLGAEAQGVGFQWLLFSL